MKLKRWLSINHSSKIVETKNNANEYSHTDIARSMPKNSTGEKLPKFTSELDANNRQISYANQNSKVLSSSVDLSCSSTVGTNTSENLDTLNTNITIDNDNYYNRLSSMETPFEDNLPMDSSGKVFGYENLGNTCYFNSILQCLYNLPEFRENILKYPELPNSSSRIRKTEMPGKKPRIFDESSFEPQEVSANLSRRNSNNRFVTTKNSGDYNLQDGLSRTTSNKRNSFKKIPNSDTSDFYSDSKSKSTSSLVPSSSRGTADCELPLIKKVMQEDPILEKLHENSRHVIVGRPITRNLLDTTSNSISSSSSRKNSIGRESHSPENTLVEGIEKNVSYTAPWNSIPLTSEQKKKAALIRGPILNVDHLLNESDQPNMYSGLKDIFEAITENNALTGVVSPSELLDILKKENVLFNSSMHQDAHEFLNFLLNELSEYLDGIVKRQIPSATDFKSNENFINKIFQGTLTNKIKCLTCDNVTSRNEPFLDFPIEVHSNEETDIQKKFKNYHQREILHGSNKFYCDECCGLQEAERIVGLKELPETLLLHMKRFKYSEEHNCNIKLFNKIHYPHILNVTSYFDSNVSKSYVLTGIVLHMGGGPHHGHYVSMCKTEKFGWLLYDDETVETVSEGSVLKHTGDTKTLTTAYILFYKSIKEDISNDEGVDESVSHLTEGDYEYNIEKLIKDDELIRSYSHQMKDMIDQPVLEDLPEDNILPTPIGKRNSSSNKSTKRRSRLFSFKRN